MEIEAKYRVLDRRIFDALLCLPALGGFLLTPSPEPELQRNIYYDTADRQIAAVRSSLRIRDSGAARVATLKRSHGGAGAVHLRDEWETVVGAEVHPRGWPHSPAREQALRIIGTAPLVPLFIVWNRRRRVEVARDQRCIAELCLDEGHVQAAGRVLGFRELEVELADDGTPEDFGRLGALLTARFALVPEPRGKRARGTALLHALESHPAQPHWRAWHVWMPPGAAHAPGE